MRKILLASWLAVLVSCSGAEGPEGPQGPQGPQGASGANGASGVDGEDGTDGIDGTNGVDGTNGTDGADGASALLRIDVEPAGPNCASGGSAVHAGIDLDNNGTLEDPEITSTGYVCNGANGGDAATGAIHGFVTRFGQTMNSGITVSVTGTPLSTVTTTSGEYLLDNIPIGYHQVLFSAPGYFDDSLEQIVVLPGIKEMEPVELYDSRRIDSTLHHSVFTMSPDQSLVVVRDSPNEAQLIELSTGDTVALDAAFTTLVQFTPDGARLVYPGTENMMIVYDIATNTRRVIPMSDAPAGGMLITADSAYAIAGLNTGITEGELVSIELDTGALVSISGCTDCYQNGTSIVSPDGSRVAWISVIDPPSGPSVTRGHLWNRSTGMNIDLGEQSTVHAFNAAGDRFLISGPAGLSEIDAATQVPAVIGASRAGYANYLSDGRVLYATAAIDFPDLRVYEPSTMSDTLVAAGMERSSIVEGADRSVVVFKDAGTLYAYDVTLGLVTLGPNNDFHDPVIAPNGDAISFLDTALGEERIWRRATNDFITVGPQIMTPLFFRPAFNRDGTAFAYDIWSSGQPPRGDLTTVDVATGAQRYRATGVSTGFVLGQTSIVFAVVLGDVGLFEGALP